MVWIAYVARCYVWHDKYLYFVWSRLHCWALCAHLSVLETLTDMDRVEKSYWAAVMVLLFMLGFFAGAMFTLAILT